MKISPILLLSFVVLAAGCSTNSNSTQTIANCDSQLSFFNTYIIAISNIFSAESLINTAVWNNNYGWNTLFVYDENASYSDSTDFLSTADEQFVGAKTFLNKALLKLQSINSSELNDFYKNDLKLRINQTNSWLDFCNTELAIIDLRSDVIYSYFYEEYSVYNDTWNSYIDEYNNDLLLQYNIKLENVNNVQSSIDLLWDQSWYK